jgi:hypothetical protein
VYHHHRNHHHHHHHHHHHGPHPLVWQGGAVYLATSLTAYTFQHCIFRSNTAISTQAYVVGTTTGRGMT